MQEAFVNRVQQTWGEAGSKWLAELPELIKSISEKWQLEALLDVREMRYHYVARALTGKAQPVVLKMGCDAESIAREANLLKYYGGVGVVRLLAYSKLHNAILIQQAVAGDPLTKFYSQSAEACMGIFAEVVKFFEQHVKALTVSLPEVDDLEQLCQSIDKLNKKDFDSKLISKAKKIRKELIKSTTDTYLCHGDMHMGNILRHQKGWVVIDPKGVIADKAYEASACDLLLEDDLAAIDEHDETIFQRISRLAKMTSVDEQRLLQCFFIRNVLSAQWFIEDNQDPNERIKLAEVIMRRL